MSLKFDEWEENFRAAIFSDPDMIGVTKYVPPGIVAEHIFILESAVQQEDKLHLGPEELTYQMETLSQYYAAVKAVVDRGYNFNLPDALGEITQVLRMKAGIVRGARLQ